jgi:uncharacterized protein
MRYKIRDIGEGGIDLRVTVTDAWLKAECPDSSFGLEGRLEPAGEGYLLRATLRGELMAPCSRCLELAPVPVESPMAVTFVEGAEEEDEETDETQDDVIAFEHGMVDLATPIRDEILLAVPMSPICRPDCVGFCPTCGVNRNLTPCVCEKRSLETSKFGALAKLKLQ